MVFFNTNLFVDENYDYDSVAGKEEKEKEKANIHIIFFLLTWVSGPICVHLN